MAHNWPRQCGIGWFSSAKIKSPRTVRPSFRHGGATEAGTSGLSDRELMVKGQWTSPKMLKNYVHKNDEMHINAHEKRRAKRTKE